MEDILSRGGDTDTNAAIVGGLVGCLHGASEIPGFLKDPVLQRCADSPGKQVPAHLCANNIPQLAHQLLELGKRM